MYCVSLMWSLCKIAPSQKGKQNWHSNSLKGSDLYHRKLENTEQFNLLWEKNMPRNSFIGFAAKQNKTLTIATSRVDEGN